MKQTKISKNQYKKRHQKFEDIKKDMRCTKCKDNRFYVLEFHHLIPKQKRYNVSQMLRNDTPWKKIEEEINKCIPLCANCHREFHFLEKEKILQ